MPKSQPYFFACLAIIIIVITLLISGSSILTVPIYEGSSIPMGTPITWMGLIALPLTIYFGVKKFRDHNTTYKLLNQLLKFSVGFAVLWVPISYLLSGNLSFSFSGTATGFQGGQLAMKLFWGYTYGIAILPMILLIIHWFLKLINTIRK
ncbi:hypothetical protein [Flagellimonas marinaquae]|uniref:hypothetical protein n=1 Tax=Flagellimonas marinaquae TaxID=254955 RepID=UPI000F8C67FB|nr:hypothetical protein [Allomuricauda aquimarina]